MKGRLFSMFLLGLLAGLGAAYGYLTIRRALPVASFAGQVQLDTASHEDLRLEHGIFIENHGAPLGRVYLRFHDNKIMNDTIAKKVTVSGRLRSTRLDNGNSITELLVESVSPIE